MSPEVSYSNMHFSFFPPQMMQCMRVGCAAERSLLKLSVASLCPAAGLSFTRLITGCVWCFDTCSQNSWSDTEQHIQTVNEPYAAPPRAPTASEKSHQIVNGAGSRDAPSVRPTCCGAERRNMRGASLPADSLKVVIGLFGGLKLLDQSCLRLYLVLCQD